LTRVEKLGKHDGCPHKGTVYRKETSQTLLRFCNKCGASTFEGQNVITVLEAQEREEEDKVIKREEDW